MRRNRQRMWSVFLAAAMALSLTGCGGEKISVVVLEAEPYQAGREYNTALVQRGDFVPQFEMSLGVDGYKAIQYTTTNLELTVDTLYVSVGDRVQKGDLLLSFQSENLQAVIDRYQQTCDQNELLMDHYRRLMKADPSLDYSKDLERMQEDTKIAKLYLEEAKEKLAGYQIIAEAPGTITMVNQLIVEGTNLAVAGRSLITEVTGTGNYTGSTSQEYEFKPGDIYKAQFDMIDYEFSVVESSWGENRVGVMEQTVIFAPLSDMSALSDADRLSLVVEKPKLTDVVYLDAGYVHENEGRYFVYIIDDYGLRTVQYVTVGDLIMGNLIITSGLSGGEKVSKD